MEQLHTDEEVDLLRTVLDAIVEAGEKLGFECLDSGFLTLSGGDVCFRTNGGRMLDIHIEADGHPRFCSQCGAIWRDGEHDPCIRDLPFTVYACCGHGDGGGYVSLINGRCLYWNHWLGRATIERYIKLAMQNRALPRHIRVKDAER